MLRCRSHDGWCLAPLTSLAQKVLGVEEVLLFCVRQPHNTQQRLPARMSKVMVCSSHLLSDGRWYLPQLYFGLFVHELANLEIIHLIGRHVLVIVNASGV